MDFLTICLALVLIFVTSCVTIIFFTDTDIPTWVAEHFGKDPAKEFEGKVVWITGASSGIGEAVAKQLYCYGAKIIISARTQEELERVKEDCLETSSTGEPNNENIFILPFDMVDLKAHEECFKKVILRFGKLDVLISNAGRSQRARWELIDLQVDKDLFELNVFSLVHLNRIALRHFLETGHQGHLAIMSSMAGVIGVPNSASYTASKFALHGYFDSLRNEIRKENIDVTLICPGPTFSGFLNECFTEKIGEKFNAQMKGTDKRMKTDRCAYLILIAISNRLEQSWISIFPFLQLAYLQSYFPYISAKLFVYLGKTGFFIKARDSRDTMKGEK